MTTNGNLMENVLIDISGEEKFSDLSLVIAYENDIKPTPVNEAIVAVSTKNCTIGPRLNNVLDTGEIVETVNREVETTLSIDIYLPYSMGGSRGHKIFDRIATFLLFEKNYDITKSVCYDTEYDKSCQAIVLKSNFVFRSIADS